MDTRPGVTNHQEVAEHVSEVKQYTKRPVTIDAVQLVAYGDFVRTVAWINDNGGSAVFSPSRRDEEEDHLIIQTIEGNMEAKTGWWVIRGVKGEFYPCEPEIFSLSYEGVETPESDVNLASRSSYRVGQSDASQTLVGGAALEIPIT